MYRLVYDIAVFPCLLIVLSWYFDSLFFYGTISPMIVLGSGMQPSVEFYKHLCDQPIASVAFGLHNFVTVKSSSERKRGSSDTPAESRLSLYVGTADCALTLLDARHGEPAGIGRETWLRPKHADSAVGMALLDAAGCPLLPPAGPALLPWAGNTPAAAAPPKAAVSPPLPQPAAGRTLLRVVKVLAAHF